jgi:hypothetical protein
MFRSHWNIPEHTGTDSVPACSGNVPASTFTGTGLQPLRHKGSSDSAKKRVPACSGSTGTFLLSYKPRKSRAPANHFLNVPEVPDLRQSCARFSFLTRLNTQKQVIKA